MTDTQRLINEWLEHDKIVLAVDYDDTIFHWRHRSIEECDRTIKLVKWVKTVGAYIMIHTSSDDDRHDEIREFCESKGLRVDSINENPIELPYGQQGKPYYNWQLCDRSGLHIAEQILETAAEHVLTEKQKRRNNSNISLG